MCFFTKMQKDFLATEMNVNSYVEQLEIRLVCLKRKSIPHRRTLS